MQNLSPESRELLVRTFVRNYDKMIDVCHNLGKDKKNIMILTEPLTPNFDTRENLPSRIWWLSIPRKVQYFLSRIRAMTLNIRNVPDVLQFDRTIPMEIFNFFDEIKFDLVVAIYTQLGSIKFAKEAIQLGNAFMDNYEDPSVHSKIKS